MSDNSNLVYIVILNWNSDDETIACLESISSLKLDNIRIIVCDNDSLDKSYENIKKYINEKWNNSFLEIDEINAINIDLNNNEKILLIKNLENYGYAGGNNIGLKVALNQKDMSFVWILNNDTEIAPNTLSTLLEKMKSDDKFGVIGSRLVEYDNKTKVQGIGGIINPWLCTTKEVGSEFNVNDYIDESLWEKKIDFVIGASLFFSRKCLETVGLLCEDYFLYYEEVDYCNRAKKEGFKIGIAAESIVFHKHGASTNKGKSEIADFCAVKNRLLISKKFYTDKYYIVYLSLLLVAFNRLIRGDTRKFRNILFMMIGINYDN